jgi:hypothetical protein
MLDRNALIKESKDFLISNQIHKLDELLSSSVVSFKYLGALLFAYGFPYVDFLKDGDSIIFNAGYESNDLEPQIVYDIKAKNITGKMAVSIKKVFKSVDLIENQLDSIILLPPEMRQKRVKNLLEDWEIDSALFSTVLNNWS